MLRLARNIFDIVMYCCYLSYVRVPRKLLQAARDTGALKEAKDKLEKQLEELTWRLQLEKRMRVCYFLVKVVIFFICVYT